MRLRTGDAPRTMAGRVVDSHAVEGQGTADFPVVKIDQVVLSQSPNRILSEAMQAGLKTSKVEVSIAYPSNALTLTADEADDAHVAGASHRALGLGFLVAQRGLGFPASVHLERFGSPSRLVLTDDPKLAGVGAAGMLALHATTEQLVEALLTGQTSIRAPRSVGVHLSGRLRSFVCVRDAALELMRRELANSVQQADADSGAPVVIEFGGPSLKMLSVADRAVLAALAPRLGAAAVLFPADEKTEVFLRDQKRSKAFRALSPDAGASYLDSISVDLAGVDPLVMDREGRVRPVRDFDEKPLSQALLGGDTGCSLRDLLAAASMLKSKRVPPGIEFLLMPGSRQQLEVLARSDALVDLLATGARIIEPDRRILSGDLCHANPSGETLRTADPEIDQRAAAGLVCSAETIAASIIQGHIVDPRALKRPVRVTVPRNLPTEDVLLLRGKEARGGAKGKGRIAKREIPAQDTEALIEGSHPASKDSSWKKGVDLTVVAVRGETPSPSALVTDNQEDLSWLIQEKADFSSLRAVIAPHIPAATAAYLASRGVLALKADAKRLSELQRAKQLSIPASADWGDGEVDLRADDVEIGLKWLAHSTDRTHFA